MFTKTPLSPEEKKIREREHNKRSYEKNKKARMQLTNEYRRANPEKVKKYYTVNWEKHGERYKAERTEKRRAAFLADPKGAWLLETFRAARVRAKKNDLPFDVDIPRIELPDFCPILGIPLNYHRSLGGVHEESPSLDRKRPHLGYVESNLRVISNRANTLKNNATAMELRSVLEYLEAIDGESLIGL